jgi:hypothetical protein
MRFEGSAEQEEEWERASRMQMEEAKMRRQQNAQLQIRLAHQQGLEHERRIKEEKHQKVLETRR